MVVVPVRDRERRSGVRVDERRRIKGADWMPLSFALGIIFHWI